MAPPFHYLADEYIFQILSWLPVLSLLRCRLVCKTWKSIISDPHFIQTHLNNSNKKQPSSVLRITNSEELYIETRDEDSVKLKLPSNLSGNMLNHIRSDNGLVTLADIYGVKIYIWNPLTRMIKLLPWPSMRPHQFCVGFGIHFGFGFDSISRTYKILRVVFETTVHIDHLGDISFQSVLVAELYSTNYNSWKWISVPRTIRGFEHFSSTNGVNTKSGILYFKSKDGIISFDLHNEVFELYPYPESVERIIMLDILDFNASLAMALKSGVSRSITSLWVLDYVDGNFSWTKKFDLEYDLITKVHLYLGGGQFVGEVDYMDGYIFYDRRKEGKKRFSHFARDGDCWSVVQFTESLVSLEGFEPQE